MKLQVKEVCCHQELKRILGRDFELGHRLRGAARKRAASEKTQHSARVTRSAHLLTSFSLYSMNLTTRASAVDLISSNLTLPDLASKKAPEKTQVSVALW